jgi:glutathione S-transferase
VNHELLIADRTYSSWSLRGWLLFAAFGLPVTVRFAYFDTPELAALRAGFGVRTVPALRIDGMPMWDSLAIAETLAERYPDAGHWPAEPRLRMLARSLAAEMHSSFQDLRGACGMDLRGSWAGFRAPEGALADLARIEALWAMARDTSGSDGWLFGRYCAADAFFAPVATRIATYGLPVGPAAAAYVARHLAEPNFRRWRAMAMTETAPVEHLPPLPFARAPWPGPAPLPARAVAGVAPVNATCPYSGKPVASDSLMELGGRVIGFCNPVCRDKTVVDPEAWPEAMALLA